MEFNEARQIAMKRFYEIHTPESLPGWLLKAATVGGKVAGNEWVVGVTLAPKIVLKPNEAWELVRGDRVLTRVDAKTGKKNIVIHYDGEPPLRVFQAKVNIENGVAEVIFDSDMSKLNESDFEPQE